MEFAPSGRFQLVDSPALPGKCACCGYAASGANEPNDRRQYVDFGMDIDYYGVVYLCTVCITTVATGLGFIVPETADEIKAESEAVKSELIRLNSAVEVINGLVTVLTAGNWIISGDDDSTVVAEPPVTVNSKGQGSNNPKAVKSADESGSDDLLSVNGNLDI